MTDWDQVICAKLAEAVERHPCLYNHGLSEYSNKIAVEKAWEAVGKEIDASVASCKERWRNMRTAFSRSLKPGRSGGKRKKPYYLHKELQFLVSFVKPTLEDVAGNLPSAPQQESETLAKAHINDDEEELDDQLSNEHASPDNTTPSQSSQPSIKSQPTSVLPEMKTKHTVKRVNSQSLISAADKAFIDFCNQQGNVTEDSPRKHFLLSLLTDVESMTDKQFRRFRSEVLPFIDGILDSSNSSHSSSPRPRMNLYETPLQYKTHERVISITGATSNEPTTSQDSQHPSVNWWQSDGGSPNV